MNHSLYGKIQGFLLALETLNNGAVTSGEYCEFTFLAVPNTGPLSPSLVKYILARIQELAPNRVWRGKPRLEEAANWKAELPQALNGLFFFLFKPAYPAPPYGREPAEPSRCPEAFMELLAEFFDGEEPKVWNLKWVAPDGRDTYPWSVAHPQDWVFEHRGEWFHLTLIYSD